MDDKLSVDKLSDDLEIISIGALYSGGQWDKKYWSCSRGKDRYPYPVGYLAIRTHAGNKYRMEICEGSKGPTFVVTTPDGNSFTGQTPDIAWENFQKKSCSKVKSWHGKRLSSIDAVELFGFRNPFVQRLLRELVANINGVAERNLVTQTNRHNVSSAGQGKIENFHKFPVLHPFLKKNQVTCKRGTKSNSSAEPRNKKTRSQVSFLRGELNNFKESKQGDETLAVCDDNNFEEDQPADSMDILSNETVGHTYKSADKILGRGSRKECSKIVESVSQLQVEAEKKVKFQQKKLDAMLEEKHCLPSSKSNDEENIETVRNKDACAPDTCDTEQCNTVDSQMEGQKEFFCIKNKVQVECTPLDVMKKRVVDDSLPEGASFSGSSNLNPEKYDFDLAGQELAKSMMTFLLPRAVPLLPKTCARRRSKNRKNKMSYFQEKMNALEALPSKDSPCNDTTDPFIGNEYLKDTKYEVPDSLDADQIQVTDIDESCPHNLPEVTISPFDEAKINVGSPVLPDSVATVPDSEDTNNVIPDSLEGVDVANNKQHHPIFTEHENRTVDGRNGNIYSLLPDEKEKDYSDQCPSLSGKFANKVGKDILPYRTCSTRKDNTCPNDFLNFDIGTTFNSKDDNIMNKVSPSTITNLKHSYKSDMIVNQKTSQLCKPYVLPSSNSMNEIQETGVIPLAHHSNSKRTPPLSESIVCRKDTENSSPELPLPHQIPRTNTANDNVDTKVVTSKGFIGKEDFCKASVHAPPIFVPDASKIQVVDKGVTEDMMLSQFNDSFILDCDNIVRDFILPRESGMQSHTQVPQKSILHISSAKIQNLKWDTKGSMELVGCFLHPSPVLSVSLSTKEDCLIICVLCGLVDSNIRNLFMYKIHACGVEENCPSFVGYTPLICSPKEMQYKNIPVEKSGLHYIVGEKSIIIFDNFKAPRCRNQNFNCTCSACTLCRSEEYTLEIVQMNFGYVTSVVRLPTTEKVSFILTCEPDYLIAVKQSGELHVWVMNLKWSASIDEFLLPHFSELSPGLLELRTVPDHKSLILGHNGLGVFALWDISKRVLLSKFVSSCTTTFQIHPIGLSEWQSDDSIPTWFPKASIDLSQTSLNNSIAVWLLISADTDRDAQDQAKRVKTIPTGCWRLGLLVKNTLILGSILNSRTSAVGISMNFGIYGTTDGSLYKCELSTGEALAVIHPFKNGRVAHIATDANSGAIAVADNGCRLQVYAAA